MCNTVLCTTYVRVLPPRGDVDLCLARDRDACRWSSVAGDFIKSIITLGSANNEPISYYNT